MARRIGLALLAASALSLAGCVSGGRRCCPPPPCVEAAPVVVVPPPNPAEERLKEAHRLMDKARERKEYLPMKPEEEARKSMPSMKNYATVPNLIRIAAAMPKTMDAEMKAWEALKREGTIDRKLMNEVFWVVSHANECGHCMGHIVFGASLRGIPEATVVEFEDPTKLDPVRTATFAFVRKVATDPAKVTKADVDSLRPFFEDAQIVELILAVCRFDTMNTLAEAFGSPLEKDNVFDPRFAKKPPQAEKPPKTGKARKAVGSSWRTRP